MEKKKAKTMQLETIKDLLNWSYANLAAYQIALKQDPPHYTRSCWMTRAKLFKGLQTGNMTRQSIYKNERDKLDKKDQCAYCGATGIPLTLDHVFAKSKRGSDSGDNLVYCCQSCNSSKGKKDYFVWVSDTGRKVSPDVAERYLKNAYLYCEKNGLLNLRIEDLSDTIQKELPFDLKHIPLTFTI